MKGFSTSIAYRFQPIWTMKNQNEKGQKIENLVQEVEKPLSEQFYQEPSNTEKCKKRSKKQKKRKREYQDWDY